MRKLIITGMALAMLAIPAAASADVPRCEASVPSDDVTTATFTDPAEDTTAGRNVWKHDFTVKVNADDTSQRHVDVYGLRRRRSPAGPTTVTGSFNADGSTRRSLRDRRHVDVTRDFNAHRRLQRSSTRRWTAPRPARRHIRRDVDPVITLTVPTTTPGTSP